MTRDLFHSPHLWNASARGRVPGRASFPGPARPARPRGLCVLRPTRGRRAVAGGVVPHPQPCGRRGPGTGHTAARLPCDRRLRRCQSAGLAADDYAQRPGQPSASPPPSRCCATPMQVKACATSGTCTSVPNPSSSARPSMPRSPTSCCRGTAPDGVPAIDEPTFLSPERVDFLEEAEPVMALEIGNDAGAYPLQINDLARDRQRHGRRRAGRRHLLPAVQHGRLLRRRQGPGLRHRGDAVPLGAGHVRPPDPVAVEPFHRAGHHGYLAGQELDEYPVDIVAWGDWRDAPPTGWC
jgi:Protein of unknown function (DUF3179)